MLNKIYYFGAEWCGQCSAIFPQFKAFCEVNNLSYGYIDVEGNEKLTNQFHVKNLPTIIVTDNNDKVIFRGVGFSGFKEFKEFIID